MEPRIKDRFNDKILEDACQRYGIAPGHIHLLDGFESFMYEFDRPDGDFILRIGHSFRRTPELIRGEVDWLNYLAAGGAGVARAVFSQEGELVEQIPDGMGEQFLATAFVKACGKPPRGEAWNAGLFERWGQLIGRMHRLTQDYTPPDPAWRRPEWDGETNMEVMQFLPPEAVEIRRHYQVLMEHLQALPRDREAYGLVHQDAHAENFFVDEAGNITLFDFDDCVYGHFIYDIAMVIFYAVMRDFEQRTPEFCIPFFRGYRSENHLDPAWLAEIPSFLKLREIDMVALIHRSFDVANLTDPWVAWFMDGRMTRMARGEPYSPVDFTQFAEELEGKSKDRSTDFTE
ncbi:MAG: phosphotransferase [Anaerolineales bacterium]|jgi:Ser/Thr protein kinase RdoA (MazF antagonist)|nr:phosphotransferase [Anaerolineales bacterium]